MKAMHIVTPVKDSIESAMMTIDAIMSSHVSVPHTYTVYNDFSTPENTARLEEEARQKGFTLVSVADLTTHPSPNYLLVLQTCRRQALTADAALVLVESDVVVQPDTLQRLYDEALSRPDCGIAASVTVDEQGDINYPYGYARGQENTVDFDSLDSTKNWFDVTISHLSLKAGLHNYLFTCLPVVHRPHGSRPWKQLKYKNPLKYYWLKLTRGLDKI